MNFTFTPKTVLLRSWFTSQSKIAAFGSLAVLGVCFLGTSDANGQLFQRESDKAQEAQTQTTKDEQLDAAKRVMGVDSGNSTNQTQAEADQEVDPDGWEIMTPTGANAVFRMPIKPRYVEKTFSPILGRSPIVVKMHIATENKNRTSVLSYHDLHNEPYGKSEVKNILEGAVKGSVVRVLGRLDEVKEIEVDGNPGREFVYSYTQDAKVHHASSRVVLAGKRQYQLTVLCAEGFGAPASDEKFLKSLVIKEPVEDLDSLAPLSNETSQAGENTIQRK